MTIDRGKLRWNGWGLAAYPDPTAGRPALWAMIAEALGMTTLLATPPVAADAIALPEPRLDAGTLGALSAITGADRVRSDRMARLNFARGKSYHDLLVLRSGRVPAAPDAVVAPRGAEEVLALVALAQERNIALVPVGGGSSVVGGIDAVEGPRPQIALDLSALDRLLTLDAVSQTARIEAGASGPHVETLLAGRGHTLGHFPQSFEHSTLGGWIAHRGAGQFSNRYGRAEDWLVSARLATPSGLWATEDFPASAAGPDLAKLVAGSEGRLGVILDATVRIHPRPETSLVTAFLFPDFASGLAAVRRIAQAGLPVAMLRLSDEDETHFFRAVSSAGQTKGFGARIADAYLNARGLPKRPCALLVAIEGARDLVRYALSGVRRFAREAGGIAAGEGPGRRWRAGRFHGPYLRDPMLDHGLGVDTLETATRWSNVETLRDAVRAALTRAMADEAGAPGARGIVMAHVSHVYRDGASLYFTFVFPRALDREVAQWRAIKAAASDAIAAHGGTISHHHGVGRDHLTWLAAEKGATGMKLLAAMTSAIDPKGVLNPGKLTG